MYPNFDLPFILTTDASNVSVAAIMSQLQNGLERPVAYASRQLNKAEQAYSTTEAELLALVWAAKHVRFYLYGRRFTVRTDHGALTYLKTLWDANAKLVRWSLRLSKLDCTVEHRAGTKIPHADALSRHVVTISVDVRLSLEEVRNGKSKEQFCVRTKLGNYSSNSEFFYDDEGLIYRRQKNGRHQLLVPREIIRRVIRINHDPLRSSPLCEAHLRIDGTKFLVAWHALDCKGVCPRVLYVPTAERKPRIHSNSWRSRESGGSI
jgi:hypothetical protein